jgi:Zn-finger nucleic acid-binding protein
MQCPPCDLPLEPDAVGGQVFDRCGRCGGEYFSNQALQELLTAHAAPPGANGASYDDQCGRQRDLEGEPARGDVRPGVRGPSKRATLF